MEGGRRVWNWAPQPARTVCSASGTCDNGPGIPSEAHTALFTRGNPLRRLSEVGDGLGLPIVQNIVEKLGGEVGLESEVGNGSLFFFTLPAAASSPSSGSDLVLPLSNPNSGISRSSSLSERGRFRGAKRQFEPRSAKAAKFLGFSWVFLAILACFAVKRPMPIELSDSLLVRGCQPLGEQCVHCWHNPSKGVIFARNRSV